MAVEARNSAIMYRNLSSDKRQLLSSFFEGNAERLKKYKASHRWVDAPYRWIINDTVAGTVCEIGKDGIQYPITPNALAKAPLNIVFKIVDFAGGKRIPRIDENNQEL